MLPEKGSRWYWAGKHWEVVGTFTHDGQTALRLKSLKTGKKLRLPVWPKLFDRYAIPSQRS